MENIKNDKHNKVTINENLIINKTYYDYFHNQLTCPIDFNLILNPLMCSKCESSFCKDCIETWIKHNRSCPNKCTEFKIIPCSKAILKIHEGLKLKCNLGCDNEINLKNYIEHQASCKLKEVSCWVCNNNVNQESISIQYKNYLDEKLLLDKSKFVLKNYNLLLSNQKRYDEAINIINKTIEIDPMFETGYLYKGITYKKMGKYELALEFLLKSLQIDSFSTLAKFELLISM